MDNPKLTFDQLHAIDVAEKRLANIQNEVSVATKVLTQARAETENVTKERLYQEELLTELTPKITALQTQHANLLTGIHDGTEHLSEVMAKARQISTENEQKLADIQRERAQLDADIATHKENVAAHAVKSKTLDAEYDKVLGAKLILTEAIAQIKL